MTRPMRIVSSKIRLSAGFHLEQDRVDLGHAKLEIARQVLLVHREMAIDFLQGREVVFEQLQSIANGDGDGVR